MVYDWKINNMPVAAQAVGEHIEQLEKSHGKITPKIVLDSARDENSLLHPCFEWDDAIAAEKYREDQAGRILRNLVVKIESNVQPATVRAFVNIKTQSTSAFLSIAKVLQDDALRDQMLEDALRDLKAFRDKYATLSELTGVFAAIDALDERRCSNDAATTPAP
jgi:hypothetical protein